VKEEEAEEATAVPSPLRGAAVSAAAAAAAALPPAVAVEA